MQVSVTDHTAAVVGEDRSIVFPSTMFSACAKLRPSYILKVHIAALRSRNVHARRIGSQRVHGREVQSLEP
jgi:hypothetical protein